MSRKNKTDIQFIKQVLKDYFKEKEKIKPNQNKIILLEITLKGIRDLIK